jgi:catechol 2,3-dioxygenase-like lactoylglutathione lyase family enzyme
MTTGIRTVIYPVADLARAKALFGALLGAGPVVDAPYYVQFDADGQAIGLDPHGHRHGQSGPVAYFHVADVATSLAALVAADVGGVLLVALARDGDGNLIGLRQAG